jgi:hypothetical protein
LGIGATGDHGRVPAAQVVGPDRVDQDFAVPKGIPADPRPPARRIETIFWTLKGQLGLERHGGRTDAALMARVGQRLLALTAAIWHNWLIGAPRKRSLVAYARHGA